MTTQDQPANDTIRRLRRRTSDRVIGGVAGGLGDYLNVDPLLIRIGFVGLMVFGGAGLVLYVIAWLLIPDETRDRSSIERLLRTLTSRPFLWIGLVAVVIVALAQLPHDDFSGGMFIPPFLLWAIIVLAFGVLLLRNDGPSAKPAASAQQPAVATTAEAQPASFAQPAPQAAPRPTVPPKPRGPLSWYTLASILIAIGLVAVLQNVASLRVLPGQYFGIALLLLGIGLAIGAWWGNARLLILLGILLLPLGVVASFLTAPIQGGFGDQTFTPQTLPDVQREYRMAGGRLVVDLSELDADATIAPVSASVGLGQLTVIVPANHAVDATVSIGGGATGFFDQWTGGTDLSNHYQRAGAGPKLVLTLEAGIGEIRILSPNERGQCIGCDCSWWLSCGYSLADEEAY